MRTHDLVIIGAGSGNAVIDERFSHLDVAVIDQGPFGGTCLNRGCIPSKMLGHAADVHAAVREASRFGVETGPARVRWADLRERVFTRLDREAAEGEDGRRRSGVTVHRGRARFTGERTLHVDTDRGPVSLGGRQVVVAAGSRPTVPPPVSDSGLPYETSDTVMRLYRPPHRLAVLGGGYVAAELAHVFHEAGSRVTVIEQADTLLPAQDETVARAYTALAATRHGVRTGTALTRLEGEPGRLRLILDDGPDVEADTLLVAVGRTPAATGSTRPAPASNCTTTDGSWWTTGSGPAPRASSPSATCARPSPSNTWRTGRRTSWRTKDVDIRADPRCSAPCAEGTYTGGRRGVRGGCRPGPSPEDRGPSAVVGGVPGRASAAGRSNGSGPGGVRFPCGSRTAGRRCR